MSYAPSPSPTPEVTPYFMKKFLHTEQPFPDNYIEQWFLSQLRVNFHLEIMPLKKVIVESLALTQQITTVVLYLTMFLLTANTSISIRTVYVIDCFLLIMCFFACIPLRLSPWTFCGWRCLILFGFIWGFVPIISTITTGYDHNTIYIITAVLFTVNIIFFDYGYINNYVNEIGGSVSFNAAVLATIVLASILPENAMVFPLIGLSIILFEFSPILRHYLNVCTALQAQLTHRREG